MKNNLDKIPNLNSKVVFDPNKVRVNDFETPITRNFDTVFLNSFKKWRNIDILIDSLKIVVSKLPNSRHRIIGAKDELEVEKYLNRIHEHGIEKNVSVEKWTDNSKSVFEDTKIFVLPADIVFLNFSLLEAMERDCTPIVWDVEGSDLIIQHGVNGLISTKTETDLADNIINLIENDDFRLKLGMNARQTIVQNFNDADRLKPIFKLIEQN
jgi:glycosyltransferase involved in cell wall biosynthesis